MPIELTDEMKERIDGAFENGTPVVVAYVDEQGAPQLSFRGTTQVLGDDRLALWARSREGGLPNALAQNPRVALLYRDPTARRILSMSGRARVAPELNETVYDRSPERERERDPERKGVAIVVDLDQVMSGGPDGVVRMQRD
jgi:pyridoxamine 5'-phosphate oxidase-like protein